MPKKEVLMQVLHLTEEEAEQLIADDKAIDRGEKMWFDLTDEQKKVSKEARIVHSHTKKAPTVYKFERKKTENPVKSEIIALIEQLLIEKGYESVEITNKERLIAFKSGENDYEITLTQKRKPKK